MANTYTRLLHHCIWSTKDRLPLISQDVEERVWAYLAGIAKENRIHPIRIGGIENHVHALIDLPKTMTISEAMQRMKGGSSKWIHSDRIVSGKFQWQDGYAAFSVSPSNVDAVTEYIARQREHHRTRSFEDELVALLEKHGVKYDPGVLVEVGLRQPSLRDAGRFAPDRGLKPTANVTRPYGAFAGVFLLLTGTKRRRTIPPE